MYRERTVRSKWEQQRVINPERWLSGLRRSLGQIGLPIWTRKARPKGEEQSDESTRVYVYSVPRVRKNAIAF